jgi:dephospho-CoA kinase
MFKVGLTGGIGSGKSQVARMLSELGASVLDTDDVSRALTTAGGAAIEAIREAFGVQAIDPSGAMNRAYMRELVFDDADQRRRLEGILHPLIAAEVQRWSDAAVGPYLVYVVPLLIESGRWVDRVNRVCVVDCPPPLQIERVQNRSGLSAERISQIMAVQATRQQRLEAADDVIDNGIGISLSDLRDQVLGLHGRWCNLSA